MPDLWRIMSIMGGIILLLFIMTAFGSLLYYTLSFSVIFIDAFSLVFRIIGYSFVVMALFKALLIANLFMYLFRTVKSFTS